MDGFGTYYFLKSHKIFLNIPIVWNLEVNADSDRIEFVFVLCTQFMAEPVFQYGRYCSTGRQLVLIRLDLLIYRKSLTFRLNCKICTPASCTYLPTVQITHVARHHTI